MSDSKPLHILTVGMSPRIVRNLWDPISARSGFRFSHCVDPSFDRAIWGQQIGERRGAPSTASDIHFIRENIQMQMPPADRELLASLEDEGVPTIHNMILSDRFVSKIDYEHALAYATLLTQRLFAIYESTAPSIVIGGFDALHGGLGYAVARRMNIPWFALYFSSMPSGQVAFCSDPSPASPIVLERHRETELHTRAVQLIDDFEQRRIKAAAYIPPNLFSPSFIIQQIPVQLSSILQVWKRRRLKKYFRYTDHPNSYSLRKLFGEALRLRRNLWQLHRRRLITEPPAGRYVFFGLHTQPESSIDVFAHFFSNQLHVIELMARSIPPTHILLVKLHKSDAPNYSTKHLAQLARFPSVQLVSPYADTYALIKNADLVFSIQGTIGLEAALLGKPVIMFGDSPIRNFPSVSTIGRTADLPRLVRKKLAENRPSRLRIVEAYAAQLAPFGPGSANDWTVAPTDPEIDGYVKLFALLANHLQEKRATVCN
jgi:hypothetical protein